MGSPKRRGFGLHFERYLFTFRRTPNNRHLPITQLSIALVLRIFARLCCKAIEMGVSKREKEVFKELLDDAPEEAEKWKREAARLREIETSRDLSGLQPES